MTFSFIIPTKNRLEELKVVFQSILNQSIYPEQIIIIDQSDNQNIDKEYFESLIQNTKIKLNYIHDQSIEGLVEAKAASLFYNKCDVVF